MALHIINHNPTVDNLGCHEELIEELLRSLRALLTEHTEVKGHPDLGPQYHANISIQLTGPQTGTPIITWTCHYCRYIYNYARLLNQKINNIRTELHQLDNIRFPNIELNQELIDPFQCPFARVSSEILHQTLATLALRIQDPPHQDTPTPAAMDKDQEEEE